MSELYWISVLGNLNIVGIISLVLLFIALVIIVVGCIVNDDYYCDKARGKYIRCMRALVIPFILSLAIVVFVPTTKELYLIYGLGSTIDYVKSNDKAKQVPDKAVEALNRYLDSIKKDKKED